ncbi:MAG TPA: FCD domain-containing protein [Gaiellales bacterium]|jgi:DNA-binding FadR family transcriptional regulator
MALELVPPLVSPPLAIEVALGPARPEGAVEQIVRRIGEAIGAGILVPGASLPPEAELAARLEVAPMTLRQALAVLRSAGFIETRRGRAGGSFVQAVTLPPAAASFSAGMLRDLTDWRSAISGAAAELAAERAPASERDTLRIAAAAVEAVVGDAAAYRRADARLHVAIAEATGSRRLVAAETQLQAELGEVLALVPGPELARAMSQAGHGPIIEAIASGLPGDARAAAERHAEATHDWVVGLLLGRLS